MIRVLAVIVLSLFSGGIFARRLRSESGLALVAKTDADLGLVEKNNLGYELSHTTTVCTQIDANFFGGVVGLSFSVSAQVEIKKDSGDDFSTITIRGMIGGGFTLSAVIIKGSAYIEGSVGLTMPIPKIITAPAAGLAFAIGRLFDIFKKRTALGRLFAKAGGWFAKLRASQSPLEVLKKAKEKELTATTFAMDKYTPWACQLPWRGHGVDQSPPRLPNEASCKRAPSGPFKGALPANYLICPSRSNGFKVCSYFCPSTGTTTFAYDESLKKPAQARNTLPACPATSKATAKIPTDPKAKRKFCEQNSGCGWTADDTKNDQARTIARVVRSDGRHKIVDMYNVLKRLKGDVDTAFAKKKPADQEKAYVTVIERAFREVYFTGKPVAAASGQGITGYFFTKQPKCQDASFNPHGENPIRPLMCIFMKYGFLLDEFGEKSTGSNEKVRLMLEKLFPTLIYKGEDGKGAFDAKISKANIEKVYAATSYEELTGSFLEKLSGVSGFLALSNTDMEARIEAYRKDQYDQAKIEESQNGCKKMTMEGTLAMGFTMGASGVGFCTPDTNPFQIKRSTTWKRTGNYQGSKCEYVWSKDESATTYTLAGSIFFQFNYIKYRVSDGASKTGTGQDRAYNFQFRLPLATGKSDFEGLPSDDPKPLEGAMKGLATWMKSSWTHDDHNGNILKTFEEFIKGLYAKVASSTANAGSSKFLKALSAPLKAHDPFVTLIENIIKKIPGLTLPAGGMSAKSENLLGFDVTILKGESKTKIALVHNAYKWAQVEMPVPLPFDPTFKVVVTGSTSSESKYEFTV